MKNKIVYTKTETGKCYDDFDGNFKRVTHYKDKKMTKAHCEDGPASIYEDENDVYESWYQDGRFHRLDGPAVMEYKKRDGKSELTTTEYYIDGEYIDTREEFLKRTQPKPAPVQARRTVCTTSSGLVVTITFGGCQLPCVR